MVDVLAVLDRGTDPGSPCDRPAGQTLYLAMRGELSSKPVLPVVTTGTARTLDECAVPPVPEDGDVGVAFRELLDDEATAGGLQLVPAPLCTAVAGRALVDHGAHELTADEAAAVLSGDQLRTVELDIHESGDVMVDPMLAVLGRYWESFGSEERAEWASAVRAHPLFPVDEDEGVVQRVAVGDAPCFFPPRSLKGGVPLYGLHFLLQDVAWGRCLHRSARSSLGVG